MREALSLADIVLIPTYPSQYDLAVLNNLIKLFISLEFQVKNARIAK